MGPAAACGPAGSGGCTLRWQFPDSEWMPAHLWSPATPPGPRRLTAGQSGPRAFHSGFVGLQLSGRNRQPEAEERRWGQSPKSCVMRGGGPDCHGGPPCPSAPGSSPFHEPRKRRLWVPVATERPPRTAQGPGWWPAMALVLADSVLGGLPWLVDGEWGLHSRGEVTTSLPQLQRCLGGRPWQWTLQTVIAGASAAGL